MKIIAGIVAACLLAFAVPATAQVNPLKPSSAAKAKPEAVEPAATNDEPKPAKPQRERSAAQKANDDRMRTCGKEWKDKKPELSAQGQTWRKFNVECRARLKAQGQ